MQKVILLAASLLAAATLHGCGTPVQHATASGNVEVTISAPTADVVKAALVNEMVNRGYRITKDTPYEVVFDKPVENFAAQLLLGSRYDGVPNARISYMIAATPPTVRVVADMAIITNPGSSFERRTPLNNGQDSMQVQTILDSIKTKLEAPPAAPPPRGRKK